jgi:hypothetical protein
MVGAPLGAVDSDFSEANPILSNFYALRGGFFRRFFAAKKAAKAIF